MKLGSTSPQQDAALTDALKAIHNFPPHAADAVRRAVDVSKALDAELTALKHDRDQLSAACVRLQAQLALLTDLNRTSDVNPDAPAFPQPAVRTENHGSVPLSFFLPDVTGLTVRQSACIQLMVADSGSPWLDKLIETRQRFDLVRTALAGLYASDRRGDFAAFARDARAAADAVIHELKRVNLT